MAFLSLEKDRFIISDPLLSSSSSSSLIFLLGRNVRTRWNFPRNSQSIKMKSLLGNDITAPLGQVEEGKAQEESHIPTDLRHHGEEGVEVVLLAVGNAWREVEVDGPLSRIIVQLHCVFGSL